MVLRLSHLCQRAGAPASFSAESVIAQIQAVQTRIPTTDYLRCGSLVAEAEDISREPVDSVDASLTAMFREQARRESRMRAIVKDAAAARSKSVKAADNALQQNLGLARARSTRKAHNNAVNSILLQFITFGVVTGLIVALISMRTPTGRAQQQEGLLMALGLSFALPLALYAVVKCQNPGLKDWLRLAAEKEFSRAFPRKVEELNLVRQFTINAADRKYKEFSGALKREIASNRTGIDSLSALQEYVRTLRDQARP